MILLIFNGYTHLWYEIAILLHYINIDEILLIKMYPNMMWFMLFLEKIL